MELGSRRYPQNDWSIGSSIVYPRTNTLSKLNIGNDSANIERIIEKPQQIDQNIWKYQHIRQFVLQLNLLTTSLKDICNKQTCPTMKGSE